MSQIVKIAHIADVHIPKSPSRHKEYEHVFKNLYKSLKKNNPDRIVIVGDLFHDYIDLQPEATILASSFLNELSKIAPVRITRGNHDIRKKSIKRIDSIEAVVKAINNPNVLYYNDSKFFEDDNVIWAVWKHGIKNNSPWKKKFTNDNNKVVIDLFHDPVIGSKSPTGMEFKSKSYNSIKNFKGDYSFFGDIHKKQFFSDNTKAYSGSLIAQNFGEGDYEFHGYLLWDINNGNCDEIEVHNDYSFNTIRINPYTDFDDLDIDIDNPSKYMRLRVQWNTLPQTYNNENKRLLNKYLSENYNPISIKNESHFIEEDEIDEQNELDIYNITEQSVQHEIFKTYLEKIGTDEDIIDEILELDNEITSRIEVQELTNIQWDIVKLSAKNFMSYQDLNIDWDGLNGLFQITGLNAVGKTTIMKLLTYILYNKTKETEKTMKFGDMRYVNNRLNVNFCQGSAVILVNGEYYGIRRTTKIEKNRNGDIKGAPTSLEYFKLATADDDFTDENSIETLNEDDRKLTQKKVERAIGTYDNFMRIVMTTSDSLNEILSNDKSVFVDSLLYDSGLDLFDHKLNSLKDYLKEYSSKPKIICNIEKSEEKIKQLESEIESINNSVNDIENNKIPELISRIEKGNDYVESLIKKLHKVDDDIYNLDITNTNKSILSYNDEINLLNEKSNRIKKSIGELKSSYDIGKLNELQEKKDAHKDNEYKQKLLIRELDKQISDTEYIIGNINGEIHLLKEKGTQFKDEIFKLKNETHCPTCGQLLDDDHQNHLNIKISEIEEEMFAVAKLINDKKSEVPQHENKIADFKIQISNIENEIKNMSIQMEDDLKLIGELIDDKNQVDRRKELMSELDTIPIKIQNFELQKNNLEQKISLFNLNLKNIEENKNINVTIENSKQKLNGLEFEQENLKNELYRYNTLRGQKSVEIRDINDNIVQFKDQERQDLIISIYKKCVHRDGIPTQLLKTYAIPKINKELDTLLSDIDFNVWLDDVDLKLKLAYNNRLDAIIDAISASGKERTFASVALKYGLNQINLKSKPSIFLLDEVMGKLTDDSVDEFVSILHAIKNKMSKVLIVEHNANVDPDYLLEINKNDQDVSNLEIS